MYFIIFTSRIILPFKLGQQDYFWSKTNEQSVVCILHCAYGRQIHMTDGGNLALKRIKQEFIV